MMNIAQKRWQAVTMLRSAVITLLAASFLLTACGGDSSSGSGSRPTPEPSVTFARSTVLLDTDEGSMLIDVEVAETDAQRRLGLMHRESLDADAGMIFVFFEPTRGGFWMKDTAVPLSIAFFDVEGRILKILDMDPCKDDPCPSYDPGVTYLGALEVNQGAFEVWGVEQGDFIRLNR
jgi:uncharacterized membrane protein (UPF0127 family)